MQRIIDKFINKQIENGTLKSEEIDIYRYAYVLLFEEVLNIMLAIVIGAIMRNILLVFMFLFMYMPLRSYCGGWHANNIWKCTVISNVILILEVILYKYTKAYHLSGIYFVVFFVSAILIIILAPIDTKSKILDEYEKKIYKKKIYLLVIIHSILMLAMFKIQNKKCVYVLFYTYIVQLILLLFEKFNQRFNRFAKDNF